MKLIHILLPQLNSKPRNSILAPITAGDKIPKIIHQTYHSKSLPYSLHENAEKIKALNPDWNYRFYDDVAIIDFIKENYDPLILCYFNKINPRYGAAKADLFRYLLMYQCGGVYLDIKSSLQMPLTEALNVDDCFVLSQWKDRHNYAYDKWGSHSEIQHIPGGEFQQWYIASAPGHPFLKAVIENVLRNIDTYIPSLHGVGKDGVLRLTGPIAYTLAIEPLRHLHRYRFAHSRSDLGFQYSIFSGSDGHNRLFGTHYSELTESIINLEITQEFLERTILFLKRIRNFVFF